jgi:hypothetical protein
MTGELMFKVNCFDSELLQKIKKNIDKGLHDGLLILPSDIEVLQRNKDGEWVRI